MSHSILHARPGIPDGSLLTEEVFRQRADWDERRQYDYFSILASAHAYGLKAAAKADWPSLDLELEGARITLRHCQAVTPFGTLVNVRKGFTDQPTETVDNQMEPGCYDLVLIAAPYHYQPWGTADPRRTSYRPPQEIPVVRIKLEKQQDRTIEPQPDRVKLEELQVDENGNKALSQTYIPPCIQIKAHTELLAIARTIADTWLQALKQCNTIFAKARRKAGEGNYTAQLIADWIAPVRQYLLDNRYYFTHKIEDSHPEVLFSRCLTLIDHVRYGFEASSDKRQLLQHIHGRLDNTPLVGDWQNSLVETLNADGNATYVHADLKEVFRTIQNRMEPIATFMSALTYDQHYNRQDAIIQTRKKSFFSL